MSTSPPAPPATRKKSKPSARSSRTKNCDAAMNGVAITTSRDVEKFAHTSSGSRKNDMPGARMVMIVTRKFSAVAIDDAPANCTPIVKKICPIGDVSDSGAYPVQPVANGPPGARDDSSIIVPATGRIQYDSASSRATPTPGAPTMIASQKFALPVKLRLRDSNPGLAA